MIRSDLMHQIDSLKVQLAGRYAAEKIVLFGSSVRGGSEVNDIDLLIIKEDVPNTGAERIRQLYRMMETEFPVDYLVYRPSEIKERLSLGDPFIEHIFKEGIVFAWLTRRLSENGSIKPMKILILPSPAFRMAVNFTRKFASIFIRQQKNILKHLLFPEASLSVRSMIL
jgi:predicted nucleotidyltransferase